MPQTTNQPWTTQAPQGVLPLPGQQNTNQPWNTGGQAQYGGGTSMGQQPANTFGGTSTGVMMEPAPGTSPPEWGQPHSPRSFQEEQQRGQTGTWFTNPQVQGQPGTAGGGQVTGVLPPPGTSPTMGTSTTMGGSAPPKTPETYTPAPQVPSPFGDSTGLEPQRRQTGPSDFAGMARPSSGQLPTQPPSDSTGQVAQMKEKIMSQVSTMSPDTKARFAQALKDQMLQAQGNGGQQQGLSTAGQGMNERTGPNTLNQAGGIGPFQNTGGAGPRPQGPNTLAPDQQARMKRNILSKVSALPPNSRARFAQALKDQMLQNRNQR